MAYIYDIADTWAASGTVFTGIKLNVTDTASNAASLLLDLQVGGVSAFKVGKDASIKFGPSAGYAIIDGQSNSAGREIRIGSSVAAVILKDNFTAGANYAAITTSSFFSWSSDPRLSVGDLLLARDAANTLAQRNGVNAQAFNLYNTYTDASNYERGFMRWGSNALRIGAENLGTGTARGIEFYTNGVMRADIAADGSFSNRSGFFYNRGGSVTSVWALFGSSNYIGTETNHVFSLRTNNLNRIAMDTVGSVQIVTALTVATLPATPLVGMMARVTDATSPTVGSTVVGGGAANAMCWYNGANWTVIGV